MNQSPLLPDELPNLVLPDPFPCISTVNDSTSESFHFVNHHTHLLVQFEFLKPSINSSVLHIEVSPDAPCPLRLFTFNPPESGLTLYGPVQTLKPGGKCTLFVHDRRMETKTGKEKLIEADLPKLKNYQGMVQVIAWWMKECMNNTNSTTQPQPPFYVPLDDVKESGKFVSIRWDEE